MRKTCLVMILAAFLLQIAVPVPKTAYAAADFGKYCNELDRFLKSNGNRVPQVPQSPATATKSWTKAKILVCLFEFPDVKPQLEPEFLISRVSGFGATEPSLEEYFDITSGGNFDIDFGPGVKPVWLKMPKGIASYGTSITTCDIAGVLYDSLKTAWESGLNPEDYDLDGNGMPEFFIMIFGGNSWTTGGRVPGDFMSGFNGMNWIMVGEDVLKNNKYDLKFSPITLYHEFSHCIGIWDLYDHTYKNYSPVGGWDIMGDGVWLGYCGMSAFHREKLGWLVIKDIKEPGIYTLDNLDSQTGTKCLRIPIPDSADEFIMIENRQRVDRGYCKSSPGSGLVFYHLNGRKDYTNEYNDTKAFTSPGIKMINGKPAKFHLNAFFSQDTGRDRLDISVSPDVSSWFTGKKEVSLIFKNISKASDKMSFELEYKKPALPTIEVQNALDFGVVRMGQTKIMPLNFFFTGKGGVRVDLEKDADWLDTNMNNFVGKDTNVEVIIDARQLSPGAYKARIKYVNDFKSGSVDVAVEVRSIMGDTNSDLVVDEKDIEIFFTCYGSKSDEIGYQAECDFNDDNLIDFDDFCLLSRYFGKDVRKQ